MEQGHIKASSSAKATAGKEEHSAKGNGELAVSSMQLAESKGELAVSSLQLAEGKVELAVSSMQLAESIEHRAEGKIPAYLDAAEPIGAERSSSRSPLGDLGAERSAVSTPWLVVKTKTKCEKYVRDKIQAMGIEAFVPVTRRTARYQRKVKVYEYPLISCYTFVRLDRSRRNQVLSLPYVQGMLRLNGKDCQVTTQEIRWLQQVSGSAMDIAAETWSVQTGDHVMIAAGQLAGMEGIILSRRSKHEVVLGLESLGLQLVIQVDPAMLVRV